MPIKQKYHIPINWNLTEHLVKGICVKRKWQNFRNLLGTSWFIVIFTPIKWVLFIIIIRKDIVYQMLCWEFWNIEQLYTEILETQKYEAQKTKSVQFSSVQTLSSVQLFATPWITACQASLSIINSWSSLKLTSIESVMPSSHLILCHPLFLLPPIPPSIRV